MKKSVALLSAIIILFSLSACRKTEENTSTESANSSISRDAFSSNISSFSKSEADSSSIFTPSLEESTITFHSLQITIPKGFQVDTSNGDTLSIKFPNETLIEMSSLDTQGITFTDAIAKTSLELIVSTLNKKYANVDFGEVNDTTINNLPAFFVEGTFQNSNDSSKIYKSEIVIFSSSEDSYVAVFMTPESTYTEYNEVLQQILASITE